MSQEEIPIQPPVENGPGEPAGDPLNPGAPGTEVPTVVEPGDTAEQPVEPGATPPPPPEAEVPGAPAADENEEGSGEGGKDADQSPISGDPDDPVEEIRPNVAPPDQAIQPADRGSGDSEPDIEDLPPILGNDGDEEVSAKDISTARRESLQDEVSRLEAQGKPQVLKTSRSREIGRGAVLKAAGSQPVNNVGGSGRLEANPKAPGSFVRHG